MANHDPNHSSSERTILWTIIVASLAVAGLFMNLNHKATPPKEALNADAGLTRVEKKEAPAHHEEHMEAVVITNDTTHTDTVFVAPAEAPAHGATSHEGGAHH
jgi:hypothetical protein